MGHNRQKRPKIPEKRQFGQNPQNTPKKGHFSKPRKTGQKGQIFAAALLIGV